VLKWPDAATVDRSVRRWAAQVAQKRPDVLQIGYFGSYARGNWGVGSDLDLVILLEHSDQPFERRGREWDTFELPVPSDLLVYTREEWKNLREKRRFFQTLSREAVWVYQRQ
jgi:predicted nucleotidyltransferase